MSPHQPDPTPQNPTSAFAPAHIIIQLIKSIKSGLKICKFLQEHLKSFCELENGVKITKTSSSFGFVIITYIPTSLYDKKSPTGSETYPWYTLYII